MIKLIAIDLDGTLLTDRKEIQPATLDALNDVVKSNYIICLATGRPLSGTDEYAQTIYERTGYKPYLIVNGGAQIGRYQQKDWIAEFPLDHEAFLTFSKLSVDLRIAITYHSDYCAYVHDPYIRQPLIQDCSITREAIQYCPLNQFDPSRLFNRYEFIDEEEVINRTLPLIPDALFERYSILVTDPTCIEILPKSVTKGSGLAVLTKHIGISLHETLVIGDNNNDLAIMECAGIGVAMENSVERIKDLADFVTLDNNHNGVAHALKHFLA